MRRLTLSLRLTLISAIVTAAAGCGQTFRDEEGALSPEEFVACSDQVFVGHVTDVVARGESGDVDVTLEAETWLKPTTGPTTVVLRGVVDPDDPTTTWRVGPQQRLVFVSLDEPGRSRIGDRGVGQLSGGNFDETVQETMADLRDATQNETTCPPPIP